MATYDGNPQDYEGIIQSGYEFRLSDYLKRGWSIFQENVGGFVGYVFVFFIIAMVINGVASLLGFGSEFLSFIMGQVASIPVAGLAAGFLVVAHKIAKNESHEFGNFFDGTKDMIQLWLGSLVAGLIAAVPIFIGMYLAIGPEVFDWYQMTQDPTAISENSTEVMARITELGLKIGIYGGLGMILTVVISALYSFTQPNILFGRLKFWDAMEVSRKIVSQKVLSFILLWLVLGFSMFVATIVLVGIPAATGSWGMGIISGFLVVALIVTFVAYSSCVNYAVYEDIVLNQVSGSMDEKIDEIGSE